MKKTYVVIDRKEEVSEDFLLYNSHNKKPVLYAMCESTVHPGLYRFSVLFNIYV